MSEKKGSSSLADEISILDKLSSRTLMSIVKERKYIDMISNDVNQDLPKEYLKRVISNESCLDLIRKDIKEQGEYQFAQNLTIKELKFWNRGLESPPNLTASSNLNNPNSSLVMKKRLREELQKSSLDKYILRVNPSRKLLRASLAHLGLTTLSNDREELFGLLRHQVASLGLEYIFFQLTLPLLRNMATEAGLIIKTSSKNLLVRHLIEMTDYIPAGGRSGRKSSNQSPAGGPSKQHTKKTSSGGSGSGKKNPNRPLKPEDIEYDFDSDDSESWDPKLNKMDDIAIASEDDGDLDASSDEEEEDIDDGDYREFINKKKKRSKKSSGDGKRKKYVESFSSGSEESGGGSKKKNSSRKS
jgi:hypothetical protein